MKRFTLLAVCALFAVVLVPSSTALAENTGTHICITIDTSFCLDLKNDAFVTNNPIVLYNVNDNAHGLGWHFNPYFRGEVCDGETGSPCNGAYWPFNNHATDQRYDHDPVLNIEKTTTTGHNGCIGYDPNAQGGLGELAWANCGGDGGTTVWVQSVYGFYVSVFYTNSGLNGLTGPQVMSFDGAPQDNANPWLTSIGTAPEQSWIPAS